MRILLLLVVPFLLLASCKEAPNETISLNSDWQFSKVSDTSWMLAKVPGTVQSDLFRNEQIPNPFTLTNEDSIQWISEEDWIYKKSFFASEDLLKKDKHLLQFKGLDTYALIYLNDSLILKTNNAFRSWEVDISDALRTENELEIVFKSTDSIEISEASKLNYELPESPRVFTRKPQFQYGWDWGPTIKTMGIWRDVSLISYNDIRMTDVYVRIDDLTNSSEAKLTAIIEVKVERPQKLTFEILNETTGDLYEQTIDVSPINSEYTIPLTIKDPKLWWTHNLGDPFLYNFEIRLKKERAIIDAVSKQVGLRTIELITEKDSKGESFYFKLNDKPVYVKGSNYIPQNILLPEVSQSDREELLNDVVDANMNMLRVWGGGVYENDEFYALCDEKGILVWQDFMYACAMYPGDASFLENAKQEAIENVKRLRQHPSIALWCGNNENSEGWHRWGWKDGKSEEQKQEIWESYYALFNHILPRVVDSLHPSISYWESSPKFGRGDKLYQFEGDAHDWWVWHDGYPFEHFEEEVPRFMSEFGFQSFPSYEAIKYFTEQDTIDLKHPSFSTHQKHSHGFSLIREYMARDFPIPDMADDYVYVSQLLQAHGISKGIHAHRRAKPYNMGTLYWQLNDCWPVVSWSSIDGRGNWKALHYEAKRAFKNVLLSTSEDKGILKVYLINDTFSEIKDSIRISHLDFFGNKLSEANEMISAASNSSEVVYEIPLRQMEFDDRATFINLSFGDSDYIHYFVKPKDLKLQQSEIKMDIQKVDRGFSVMLESTTLQKNVFLIAAEKGKWKDNFFDLLPNETKEILFITEESKTPLIQIKTLNQLIEN